MVAWDWSIRRSGTDGWALGNRSAAVARGVYVEFTGTVDGRAWREGVTIRPPDMRPGDETYVHIFRSDTVTAAVVTWRGGLGRRRRRRVDLAGPAGGSGRSGIDVRTAVLPVDRSTVLPLTYTYDHGAAEFRSLGYVRLEQVMLPTISASGPDTPAGRDAFLVTALTALTVPRRRAERIVRAARHS